MELQSIKNPVWLAYAIQIIAKKYGFILIPTFFANNKEEDMDKKKFNPTFFLLRAIKDGEHAAFAYVSFRTKRTPSGGIAESLFSSVAVINAEKFDLEKSTVKYHIKDFDDTNDGVREIAGKICEGINELLRFKL